MAEKSYKCESPNCNRKFDEYERSLTNSNNCIFHCNKDNWYELEGENKNWQISEEKREYFWKKLNESIIEQNIYRSDKLLNRYSFKNFIFPYNYGNFFPRDTLDVTNFSKISKDIYFEECVFLDNIEFSFIVFDGVVSFCDNLCSSEIMLSNCEFKTLVAIKNEKEFKGTFNFYNSKFFDEVRIENSHIRELELFSCEFNSLFNLNNSILHKIDFEYTKLKGVSSFKNTKFINKLDLSNSLISGELNLLGIEVTGINRETARIIKNSFEQQNNIIEANKFYALEMKEREKELEADLKKGKNFFEWLVFKIHGISSNHSQDWLLALFWIINFTFAIGIIENNFSMFGVNFISFIPFIFIMTISLCLSTLENIFKNIFLIFFSLISYGLYSLITCDFQLYKVVNHINPFSVMNSWDNLTFGEFLYKIIIAYLIYQLIISIRQNTRRK
ncbi:hypothetical protein [Halarcobacter anaerophilus]|nr:hypothetical protein [Halarcobacter anaerophilus]